MDENKSKKQTRKRRLGNLCISDFFKAKVAHNSGDQDISITAESNEQNLSEFELYVVN